MEYELMWYRTSSESLRTSSESLRTSAESPNGLLQIAPKPPMDYQNPEMCADCGGQCCDYYPGAVFPDDLNYSSDEEMASRLHEMLDTGRYTMDLHDGSYTDGEGREIERRKGGDGWELPTYFPRPARKGREGDTIDNQFGGNPCTFKGEQGCELPHDERPTACRALKPGKDGNGELACKSTLKGEGTAPYASAWHPHQHIIDKVLKER